MDTMKAVRIHGFGGPEVLVYEDAPVPAPAAGEVLVKVHAAGVNPVDWKVRRGSMRARMEDQLPYIIGWDVSGTVVGRGAGAGDFQIGDEVYGMIRFPEQGAAYAEYATAPQSHLARKPATLDHIHAAGVPLAALTAWQALFDTANLQAGQTVLIHAAAGGVGHLAAQFAKWKGARVIGTASARNHGFLREIGVDETIDYHAAPFESVVKNVDVVLDTIGGETLEKSFEVIRPGGTVLSIVDHAAGERGQARNVKARWVLVEPNAAQLVRIGGLIDAGVVRPLVETSLPLAEARAIHELSESGRTRGKLVLRIAE